jgi:hypothetical protein
MLIRNRERRWVIEKPVLIRISGFHTFVECRLDDLSMHGMKLTLPHLLPRDIPLAMEVQLEPEVRIHPEVWVVWHTRVSDEKNSYGLYFSKMDNVDREKLSSFCTRACLTQVCASHQHDPKGGNRMQSPAFEDKRIFERISSSVPVKVLDLHANREFDGMTYDVSAKGLGLELGSTLMPQSQVEIWLRINDRQDPLYTRGNVVWSRPEVAESARIGVHLDRADLMGVARFLRAT